MARTPPSSDGEPNPLTYADIKALAKELDRPVTSLIALSPGADPFYIAPARQAAAEWFGSVWEQLLPGSGVHVRRLFYAAVSTPGLLTADGSFQNTEENWQAFTIASIAARALELVDAGQFVDRRAGEPVVLYEPDDEDSDAEIEVDDTAPTDAPAEPGPRITYTPGAYNPPTWPGYVVTEPQVAEPYDLVICVEKSTMNDILAPLAEEQNVTLISGVGELSWTHAHQLVQRARASGRPTRAGYASDLDPAGDDMPVSFARKIEFILRRDGLTHLDIRLEPLLLTAEQARRYRLPRTPIKESDRRKEGFEEKYGEGATELDALEAVRPGELRRIVLRWIERYRQPGELMREEAADATDRLREHGRDVREQVLADHATDIARLNADYRRMQAAVVRRQEQIERLVQNFQRRLNTAVRPHIDAINAATAPFHERASELFDAIHADLEANLPDPATAVEWPEPYVADESDDQLFQSARSYLEQLSRYKQHQGKPDGRVWLTKTCEVCGKEFQAQRSTARVCGDECRRQIRYLPGGERAR